MTDHDATLAHYAEQLAQSVRDHYADGVRAGRAAGLWVIDGNTTLETAQRILEGLRNGDPEIYDMMPSPLSGEWAGESMVELLGEGFTDENADAYEKGFNVGWENEVTRAARAIAETDNKETDR